jgi:hypothetical protein
LKEFNCKKDIIQHSTTYGRAGEARKVGSSTFEVLLGSLATVIIKVYNENHALTPKVL